MVEHRCEHAVFGGKREARNEVRYVLQAIRQLNRRHWETTSTYMLFQGGIIYEADNPDYSKFYCVFSGHFFESLRDQKTLTLSESVSYLGTFLPHGVCHTEEPASLVYSKGSLVYAFELYQSFLVGVERR